MSENAKTKKHYILIAVRHSESEPNEHETQEVLEQAGWKTIYVSRETVQRQHVLKLQAILGLAFRDFRPVEQADMAGNSVSVEILPAKPRNNIRLEQV